MSLINLDIQTLLLILFFGNLTVVFILAAYKSGSDQIWTYREFMAGKLLQTATWLLFILRGDIPDIFSVQIANSFLIAGFALETLAMTNSDWRYRHSENLFTIIAGSGILLFWLSGSAPPNIRITIASLGISALYMISAGFLLTHPKASRLRLGIGSLYGLFCLILIFRASSSFFSSSSGFTLYTQNVIQTLTFFPQFLFILVGGIGFLLLLKEHDDSKLVKSNDEQRKLITALSESESFTRGLVENLPDYIVVYGEEGTILYVNPAIATALGYQPDQMVARPIILYISEEFQNVVAGMMSARLEGRELPIYETDLITRDEERRTVIVKGSRIQYQNRPAILLLLIDITERKRTEQILKENEKKFVSIFQETPDPILIVNSAYEIIEVNREFEKIFPYSNENVTGKSLENLNTGLTKESLDLILENTESNEYISHGELKLIKKTNVPFMADVAISRIVINSLPCLLIEIHDIDTIFFATKAVTEANHKLKILTNITRHDILNRIMVTSFYSEEIKNVVTDEEILGKIQKIVQVTEEIQTLIEFTRQYQELGVTAPDWQQIENILEFRDIQGILEGIKLSSDLEGLKIYADMMLERVLFNLVENSIRHGRNLTRIRLTCHEEEGDLILWYEDDGGGIAGDEKEHVFERGFGKNTGLGLFLIREILSITGISIIETGEPGIGVRFEIRVPAGKWQKSG